MAVRAMKSDQLDSHEVVAGCDTRRHVEVLPTGIANHTVDTPLSIVGGKTVLSDLEPLETASVSGCSVWDLREVGHCRAYHWPQIAVRGSMGIVNNGAHTLVTLRNRVVRIIRALRTANDMAPPSADTSASGNIDDVAVLELNRLVAGEVGVVHILNGLSYTVRNHPS